MAYESDQPVDALDASIVMGSGPEPQFDGVMQEFLLQGHAEILERTRQGGLLQLASLGTNYPWLYRLTFSTKGYQQNEEGEITIVNRHVVAVRFLPDYLRRANQFAMLRLIEPSGVVFHPNISPSGAICVEVYPGEPLLEICLALHDVIRWRLRQYDDRDALNPAACAWGRDNVDAPIDVRPLFGHAVSIQWQSAPDAKEE